MLMKTFIEHLVGIEDVECAATYRAAVKGWQSGHYVAPGLAVIPDSRRRSEPRSNADCGGYAIDTLARHDGLDRLTDAEPGEQPEPRVSSTPPRPPSSSPALHAL